MAVRYQIGVAHGRLSEIGRQTGLLAFDIDAVAAPALRRAHGEPPPVIPISELASHSGDSSAEFRPGSQHNPCSARLCQA